MSSEQLLYIVVNGFVVVIVFGGVGFILKWVFNDVTSKVKSNSEDVTGLKENAIKRPEFNDAIKRMESKIDKHRVEQRGEYKMLSEKVDNLSNSLINVRLSENKGVK